MSYYNLLLVGSKSDLVITKGPVCDVCFQSKMRTTILSRFETTGREVTQMQKQFGIKAVRVRCDCPQPPLRGTLYGAPLREPPWLLSPPELEALDGTKNKNHCL